MKVTGVLLGLALLGFGIGPNVRFAGAMLQDWFFIAVLGAFVLVADRRFLRFQRHEALFAIPAIVVGVAAAGKVAAGMAVTSEDVKNVLTMVKLYLVAKMTMAYLAGEEIDADRAEAFARLLRTVLAVEVTFVGLVAVAQAASRWPDALQELFRVSDSSQSNLSNVALFQAEQRVTSIYAWANALGVAVATFVTLLLCWRGSSQRVGRSSTFLRAVALVLGFVTIYLTGSRTTYLFLLAALAVCYRYAQITLKRLLVWVGVGGGAIALAAAAFSQLSAGTAERASELVSFLTTGTIPYNLATRFGTWSWMPGYVLRSQYWLWGMPNRSWQEVLGGASSDNQYLGWLLHYGVFGLCMLCVWTVSMLVALVRSKRRLHSTGSPWWRLAAVVVVLWTLLVLAGVSQDTLLLPRLRELVFAVSAAVIFAGFGRSPHTRGEYAA